MVREHDVMAPKIVLFSLVAAAGALAGAVLVAILGQGLGGLIGGCGWIGISSPLDRQVWALMNQPTLNFSSLPRSLGYWAGSYILPLLVATGSIQLLPRARTIAAELVVMQWAWGCALVGVAWLPLVDAADGHLARWLELWDLPHQAAWCAPVLALPTAVFIALRLLELVRVIRRETGRSLRLGAVTVHLGLPAVVWVGLATWMRHDLMVWPTVAAAAVVLTALVVAWIGYPPAFPHRLEALTGGSWGRVVVTAVVLAAIVVGAGRPVAGDRRAGILWAHPGLYNNVRPWIDTTGITPSTRAAELLPEHSDAPNP
jgi:hypothetical protein